MPALNQFAQLALSVLFLGGVLTSACIALRAVPPGHLKARLAVFTLLLGVTLALMLSALDWAQSAEPWQQVVALGLLLVAAALILAAITLRALVGMLRALLGRPTADAVILGILAFGVFRWLRRRAR